MIVGIISDTHDNTAAIAEAVRIFNARKVEAVIHSGDIISPFTQQHFAKLDCKKMFLVYGNNDGEKKVLREKYSELGTIDLPPLEFELAGKRFVVFHAGMFLDELAKSGQHDYVLHGHTHKRDIRKAGNALIINPGEAGGWLTGKKSVVLLDTATNKTEVVEF